ncbi:MAG TPA: serine hydrolase domain-containing protein [Candidatus Aminicenantes bacterium]|nr:serine hydrolase domain-containing protein [Candidatus Aminicenantes bacterium]HRY64917.1 serine hydrolase domain-containing protein [Candidatus Aminicenantes bacterium]HRZ71830.1 serine hydrolase domain-containing protein [Candidatus Aminicenantes bacterium]
MIPKLLEARMNRKYSLRVAIAAVLIGLALPALAADLPRARPEIVGLSSERLARIGAVMQQYVDEGRLGGVVTLVARGGKVAYLQACGRLDPATGAPMTTDAIFRIASQTKALTGVAVMILFEEGRLLLGDPVGKYIPEFKATTVAVPDKAKKGPGYRVVPAKRQITIRDLLTHTAGISYGNGPAGDLYKAAGLQGWFLADRPQPVGTYVKKLAALPFDAQPGEKWVYGYNYEILGYLVEVVSGMSLADFIRARITEPLAMADTSFFLPGEKAGRLSAVYGIGPDGKAEAVADPKERAYAQGPRLCYAGGAGLLSTAEDYARFLLMLQSGGEWGGVHILSPKSVELMTVDHCGPLYGGSGNGFGLGFWVTRELGRSGEPGTVGAYGWSGAYHTSYWVDPVEKLVAVFMTQLLPATGSDAQAKFKALVYQSIVESYGTR